MSAILNLIIHICRVNSAYALLTKSGKTPFEKDAQQYFG